MINFENIVEDEPYKKLESLYSLAKNKNQTSIQALVVASYSSEDKEVDARFVNLKTIDHNEFIFFSNYNSPKSLQFESHNQISAILFWDSINVQIRMKAKIIKTTASYNQKYFIRRSPEKNALAISSSQSNPINSYEDVKANYKRSLEFDNLNECPDFWGGYSFTPYYFEFWEGHSSRLNKRDVFKKNGDNWLHSLIQP